MHTPECSLCKKLPLLEDPANADVVWRFPHGIAYLGKWQFYHGYCVLVSRQHAAELSDLDDATRRAFLDEMCVLARAILTTFKPLKLNYELLGNQVPHLHWHLFARYVDDPARLNPVWLALDVAERDPAVQRQLEAAHVDRVDAIARLRATLQSLDAPRA